MVECPDLNFIMELSPRAIKLEEKAIEIITMMEQLPTIWRNED